MIYIIIFLILLFVSILYLKFAEKFQIIDTPNKRSSHILPTIRGGGILFVLAFLMYQITIGLCELYLFISVLIIATVSFIDDIVSLTAKVRFPFQILSVILVVYQIGGFDFPLWIPLLTIFLCTAFINFYNFMDGINGITGMYSIVVLLGMYVVNIKIETLSNDLIIIELLSLVVFGYYNFRNKARFFAGDIGSVSIALLLVYMLMTLLYKTQSPIYILLIIIYIVDATITLLYRLVIIKENITEAHRHHIYQKLVDRTNLTHLKVSGLYSFLQCIMVGVVWLTIPYSITIHYIITGLIIVVLCILYFIIFIKTEKLKLHN